MKALVTGGGGFLGGAVARMLHERGDDVTVFGRRRYRHIEHQGIRTVQGDLRDAQAVRAMLDQIITVPLSDVVKQAAGSLADIPGRHAEEAYEEGCHQSRREERPLTEET